MLLHKLVYAYLHVMAYSSGLCVYTYVYIACVYGSSQLDLHILPCGTSSGGEGRINFKGTPE